MVAYCTEREMETKAFEVREQGGEAMGLEIRSLGPDRAMLGEPVQPRQMPV